MNSNVLLLNPQSRILQRKCVFLTLEVILVYDNFYSGHESATITKRTCHCGMISLSTKKKQGIMGLMCSYFAFEEIRLIHERHVSEMPFEELLGLGPPMDS